MGRVWRSFEVHDRKNLDCCEGTAGRNMDVKGILVRVQKEENFRESLHLFREYVNNHEQNVGSNTHGRGFPGGAVVDNPPAKAGDTGLIPGPGRSHMPRSN